MPESAAPPQSSLLQHDTTSGKPDEQEAELTSLPTSISPSPGDSGSPHHHLFEENPLHGGKEQNDSPSGFSPGASAPLPTTEEELLARAAAVGNAALWHKEKHAAIEVQTVGIAGAGVGAGVVGERLRGEVGAYESSEIVVAFAPMSVGEFRVVKVSADVYVSGGRYRWFSCYVEFVGVRGINSVSFKVIAYVWVDGLKIPRCAIRPLNC